MKKYSIYYEAGGSNGNLFIDAETKEEAHFLALEELGYDVDFLEVVAEIAKPKKYKYEKEFEYLDDLRESGVVNMFGAGEYIESEFGVSKYEAREILSQWMNTFSERKGL